MSITTALIEHFKNHLNSEDHPSNILEKFADYTAVTELEEIFDGDSRWFNHYQFVYHIPSENSWVIVSAGIGKTEYQDENEIYEVFEAVPQEKITIKYIRKA